MAKILIIDDLIDNIITLQALIKDCFPKITTCKATSGEEGIKVAKDEQPDLILLDILMPGMDGFETCQLLKNNDYTSNIPIVFVTALKENKANRIKALEVGADGFLTKPVDDAELTAQIKAMLRIKEAADSQQKENEKLERLVKERTATLEKQLEDLQKAENEIEQERLLLKTLINNLPSAIYIKDKEGRKIIANKRDLENIGASDVSEIVGKNDLELFDDIIGPRGYRNDMDVIETGQPIIDIEENITKEDGSEIWISTSKLPLYDNEGNITGLIGIGHDITAQKQMIEDLKKTKEQAEASDRLKSAFLANMSHEIRTPMNGILGFTDLLKGENVTELTRKMYIENIQKSGYRMLNTVNDIIEISKIEVGEVTLKETEFDLNTTLRDICNFFNPEASKKHIHIESPVLGSDDEFIIKSDQSKVESIITNLIKNAIKYSDKGSIKFSYQVEDDKLHFSCIDNGIGIPQERIEAIFNRFEQADIEDRLAFQGSGLGLAITKAYVEMLEGDVWVESTVGEGSNFQFTIGYHPVGGGAAQGVAEIPDDDNDKKNILIVDDDEISSSFLEIILSPFAKNMYFATNGAEGVDACIEKDIDIVFMDLKMPIMNGFEATKRIREFAPDLPIIAQTAYALGGDRERALEAGCSDYVTKPIAEDKLIEIMGLNP